MTREEILQDDTVICESCGHPVNIEEAITWPGDDGIICQECWEAECDKAWWEMVQMFPTPNSEHRLSY